MRIILLCLAIVALPHQCLGQHDASVAPQQYLSWSGLHGPIDDDLTIGFYFHIGEGNWLNPGVLGPESVPAATLTIPGPGAPLPAQVFPPPVLTLDAATAADHGFDWDAMTAGFGSVRRAQSGATSPFLVMRVTGAEPNYPALYGGAFLMPRSELHELTVRMAYYHTNHIPPLTTLRVMAVFQATTSVPEPGGASILLIGLIVVGLHRHHTPYFRRK